MKFWSILVTAKITNVSIRTRSKVLISAKNTFSLFTACTHCKQNEKIQKLPITVATEEKEKFRAAPMSCVSKVFTYSINKMNQKISNVYNVSDGYAAQFCSRFEFIFLIFFRKGVSLEWHYKEPTMGTTPWMVSVAPSKTRMFLSISVQQIINISE